MLSLDQEQLRRIRLHANYLHPATVATDATSLTRAICGMQAQDPTAAALAVQPRSTGLTVSDVKAALEEQRAIVRTWAMRGTLHLLATEDLSLLLSLLGPLFIHKSRRRYQQLGLDEPTCRKAMAVFRDVLAGQGALSRSELANYLTEAGIPAEGQATYHLIRRAALEGILCVGPERQGEETYVLLETWVGMLPLTPDEETAQAELVRRYLAAFGPAGPEDFTAWSGLGIQVGRNGFAMNAGRLLEVDAGGSRLYMLAEHEAWLDVSATDDVVARLLPAYDSYLLGYRNRSLTVPDAYERRVHPGGGQIQPTVLVDGRAAGRWRWEKKRRRVIVEPFTPLPVEARCAIEQAAKEFGRFLGCEQTDTLLLQA